MVSMNQPEWVDPERENLTWETFGEASRELTQQIVDSGWVPDLIIAVARGGLIAAGALGYAMGIKPLGSINVEFYTDIGQTLPEPMLLPPYLDSSNLAGKRVLVVDDVADSGETLNLVCRILEHEDLNPNSPKVPIEVRSAVIYTKPSTTFQPDYSWKETDKWINFCWSVQPVITADGSFKEGS